MVGELSETGDELECFHPKKDVSLFGANDMLGLECDADSFDPVVRCVVECEFALGRGAGGPVPPRLFVITGRWFSSLARDLNLAVEPSSPGSLMILE